MSEVVAGEPALFPAGWLSVSLGELEARKILLIRNGFSCGDHEIGGRGVPHFRPFNVAEDGRVSLREIKTIPYRAGMEEYALQPGDVLYNNTNSEELVGKCAYWSGRDGLSVLSNHMTIMRVCDSQEIDPRFLALHLYWFWLTGRARLICRRHVNQASIGLERMRQVVIQCPASVEQRAIAALLAKLQAAVEVQERIVAMLKELKAATMAKLFREGLRGESLKQTEIGEIPRSWDVVRLDAVADLVSGGTPSKSRPEWWEGLIPWASPKDMKRPRLWDTEDHISSEGLENGSRLVPARTLFVVIRGMILAKDVPVAMAEVPMAFNQDMKGIVPREAVDAEYLLYGLASRKVALIQEISTSAHGTRRMGTSSLEALLLPLPAHEEQRRIVDALRALEQQEEVASRSRAALGALFSSMLSLLMTGQVRVKAQRRPRADDGQMEAHEGQATSSAELPEAVTRYVAELVRRFAPERVILFGSHARGTATAGSDVDLLVQMAFEGRGCDQAARIDSALERDFSLDLLVRRPEAVRAAVDQGDPFMTEIVEQGRVLYARGE
jgi:type I restriction enzyme S subunit